MVALKQTGKQRKKRLTLFDELVLNSCQGTYCLKEKSLVTRQVTTDPETPTHTGRKGKSTFLNEGPQMGKPSTTATYSGRSDRGLAEEPLGLLELPVPPIVFAIGVSKNRRNT